MVHGSSYGVTAIENVASYSRVTTRDGRQDCENQLPQLREYCEKQGCQIASEYVDHDTGGHSRRKHFQKISRMPGREVRSGLVLAPGSPIPRRCGGDAEPPEPADRCRNKLALLHGRISGLDPSSLSRSASGAQSEMQR